MIAVALLAVAMLATPLVGTAQAWGRRRPTETYDDLRLAGPIRVYDPFEAKVWKWRNIQFGRYPAYCPFVSIRWNFIDGVPQQRRIGTAEYTISYTINTKTLKGVVNLKTKVTVGANTPDDTSDDGTFVGNMFWIGDLLLGDETTPYPNSVTPNFMDGTYIWYTSWRGTDAYAGWTITQNMHWENGVQVSAEQCLIKPID